MNDLESVITIIKALIDEPSSLDSLTDSVYSGFTIVFGTAKKFLKQKLPAMRDFLFGGFFPKLNRLIFNWGLLFVMIRM